MGHTTAELHRAAIVAALLYDECNTAAVRANDKAKSMLDADLAASLKADRECRRAYLAMESAHSAYRSQLVEEMQPV